MVISVTVHMETDTPVRVQGVAGPGGQPLVWLDIGPSGGSECGLFLTPPNIAALRVALDEADEHHARLRPMSITRASARKKGGPDGEA